MSNIDLVDIAYAELADAAPPAFTVEHGSEPDEVWRRALGKLTVDEFSRGLRAVAITGAAVNLSQFLAACRTGRVRPADVLRTAPPATGARSHGDDPSCR